MTFSRKKAANLLLAGGGALIFLGGALVVPRLSTYVETLRYTQRIPTAPPFQAVATAQPTPTPTPIPTPTSTSVPDTSTPVETPPDTPTATPTPAATPTEVWKGTAPISLSIPSINLEAPVVPIGWSLVTVGGQEEPMWDVPNYRAAGWHETSVPLGVPGNTVLNGHNTSRGEVFRDLYKLEIGAQVFLKGEDGEVYVYRVAEKYILREAGQPLSVRLENARYIEATQDERVTFVTCHPYGSLANRLVVIAYPATSTHQESGGAK